MPDNQKSRTYERPVLERYGTFRELTRSGSGTPTCDAVFQIGSSSALAGDNLGRCYE
jgi:hypothetical protein